MLFADIERNKSIILGAYKKLKSYYYYDNTILYNKASLANFESDAEIMQQRVQKLAEFLCSLENSGVNYRYLSELLRRVKPIPVPKSFEKTKMSEDGILIRNTLPKDCLLDKINFFVKAPIEILILDVIWVLMIGKISYQQKSISNHSYANKLKDDQLYNSKEDLFEGIDFESNRLFHPYFNYYKAWRDNAFKKVEQRYENRKDSILLSMDIKSYFYSVVFDFIKLPGYLNNDKRLQASEPLTSIIKRLYIDFTAEVKKYRRNIPADCAKGQCLLPIGLHSSMFLANLYLRELDDAIIRKLNPSYYGRYVDDILLVVDKPVVKEITLSGILSETLVNNGLIKPESGKKFRLLVPDIAPNYLFLQSSKIKCVFFDYTEPDALIKLLKEASHINASMSEGMLMPDIELSEKSFNLHAYSVGDETGILKIRDIFFTANSYSASIYLNDLLRISKNVDTAETKFCSYINNQLEQILQFYNFSQGIEYSRAWIKVFTLTLLNKRYDCFVKFYLQLRKAIESISTNKIESIQNRKKDILIRQTKETLVEQLEIAMSVAIAPFSIMDVKDEIANQTGAEHLNLPEILDNAKNIRTANMFNNHYTALPLISYLPNITNNISLTTLGLDDITKIVAGNEHKLLDDKKIELCPRFVHFEELCMLRFVTSYCKGGSPFRDFMDKVLERFQFINKLKFRPHSFRPNKDEKDNIHYFDFLFPTYVSTDNVVPVKQDMKVAIASICLEEADVAKVLQQPMHGLSPTFKRKIYCLLNEAKKNHAHMVVFPEYFLPVQWLEEIYRFARINSIAIVGGLRYITNQTTRRAYNYVATLQPFNYKSFRYVLPLIREKNHYAPAEKAALQRLNFRCSDPVNSTVHVMNWQGVRYSCLVCYELTNIAYRHILRGKIDMLIVPELNKDTAYFSNIVESASRDLHCFVVQVNTAKYGDSRLTGPYNTLFKDIVKIKGGENPAVLVGTLKLNEVKKKRRTLVNHSKKADNTAANNKKCQTDIKEEKLIIKDPPAGYFS